MAFLDNLYPSEGYLIVGYQDKNHIDPKTGKEIFKQRVVKDLEAAKQAVQAYTREENNAFIAQASFSENILHPRTHTNVRLLKNFWLDIDCGKEKDYETQADGVTALRMFCATSGFPLPSVVISGNGLYAHWVLDEAIAVSVWKNHAVLLAQIINHHGFNIDSSCTTDQSRVLRPIGSLHFKDRQNPKQVRLLHEAPMLPARDFLSLIVSKASAAKIVTTPKATAKINSTFEIPVDHRPSYPDRVAAKCSQVGSFRDTRGNCPEPLWYAMIGLLRHCVEGSEKIHEWSQGHPDYDQRTTDRKIQQHIDADCGPTCCATFRNINPSGCQGCTRTVTSPIILGYHSEAVPAEVVHNDWGYIDPPKNYYITVDGVILKDGDVELVVNPYPIGVIRVNRDMGIETFTVKHRTPHNDWEEFTAPTNVVVDIKKFGETLCNNGLSYGPGMRKLLMHYLDMFIDKIRAVKRATELYANMGWHGEDGDLSFVLGSKTIKKGGVVEDAGFSSQAPLFIQALSTKGDVNSWVAQTEKLNAPGCEGLAFEFLCAAFGSPLIKFTGYGGAMVCVVGASGLGKTVTGRFGLSAWGDPEILELIRDDTMNAVLGRLGAYGSLPAFIDEVSNMQDKDASEMAYRFTQGREKLRLTKNANEKGFVNKWQLLAIGTSNQSLVDKLAAFKADASGEINRIFEYEIHQGLEGAKATDIVRMTQQNYGHVGIAYAKSLVENQEQHQKNLDAIVAMLNQKAFGRTEERFWIMMGAVAIYGGLLAKKLGLSHVNVERLIPWICETIKSMRDNKSTITFDAYSWFGAFLDRHVDHLINVPSYDQTGRIQQTSYRGDPRGRLVARIEEDRARLWVSADVMRKELTKEGISMRHFSQQLSEHPAGDPVVKQNIRITLGRGTPARGTAQACWEFDLTHPELQYKTIQMVMQRPLKGVASNA